jgi:ketosteroid isomerase-like protein
MTPTPLDIVHQAYDAFGRGDINGVLALLDDGVQWTTPGPPDLPFAGRRTGKEAVAQFFAQLVATIDVEQFRPKEFVSHGDRVIVIGEEKSRVKATGKVIPFDWVHAFTVRDGKITTLDEYGDVSAMVAELRLAQTRV